MNILTIDIGGTFIKYACMLEDMTDGFVLIFGTFVFGCFPAFSVALTTFLIGITEPIEF